ncbi:hypothetical protein LTR97_011486 [Elasticomyces elasticus]|uniref:F-box domain-containing protein n=1 Tax=Elasticomyces elasticus TaxID=574655 RepID=A0AAN7VWV3_9PEZI|nr:hypothetical protein LTR97_011486 [Elasticomyces elasticus]
MVARSDNTAEKETEIGGQAAKGKVEEVSIDRTVRGFVSSETNPDADNLLPTARFASGDLELHMSPGGRPRFYHAGCEHHVARPVLVSGGAAGYHSSVQVECRATELHPSPRGHSSLQTVLQQRIRRLGLGIQPVDVASVHDIFPLFKLPPEIWIHICRLATIRDPILLNEKLEVQQFKDRVAQPAITQTCWAIRKETLDTFYASSFVYMDLAECGNEADRLRRWLGQEHVKEKRQFPGLVIESIHGDVVEYHNHHLTAHKFELGEVDTGSAKEWQAPTDIKLSEEEEDSWRSAETIEMYKLVPLTKS